MAVRITDGLDRLRQPEYTGENRCIPCTVVNLLLAIFLANVAIAIGVWTGAPIDGAIAGSVVFVVGVLLIYFRGYLVPGTPWLTRTYFPDWLLARFDKRPSGAPPEGDVDVETTLVHAGAVAECEDENDLCLEDDFRAAWRDRIATVRDTDASREDLATVLDVDRGRLEFTDHGGSFVAEVDDRRVGQWESRAAFLADMGAERELRSRYAGWSGLGVQDRSAVLSGLRIFLERCPGCDGPVTVDQESVRSCCRSIDVVAVACDDCDARLFEAEMPATAE